MNSYLKIWSILSLICGLIACAHMDEHREPASHQAGAAVKKAKNPSQPASSWVELGPGGQVIVRSIIGATDDCPDLEADGRPVVMQMRVPATASFNNAVCEASLPTGTQQATVNAMPLPLLTKIPQKILVVGDTGCRVKNETDGKVQVQDCNDPKKGWPFAELAKAAAAQKPDLVIHVGDYHYREAACPSSDASKCGNSPYGDVWNSWSADFFTPAAPLLATAPWIFVRGNHEICQRAYEGFFRYLDPRPLPVGCIQTTDPYVISAAGVNFVVLDSAQSNPTGQSVSSVSDLSTDAILLTHRPLWVSAAEAASGDDDGDDDDDVPTNLVQPLSVGVPNGVSLVLTGHRHLFRAFSFKDNRPIQITAGNGGTKLEGNPTPDVVGTSMDARSTTLTAVSTLVNFGFVMFERQADASWVMNLYSKKGEVMGNCHVTSLATQRSQRQLACSITGSAAKKKKSPKK